MVLTCDRDVCAFFRPKWILCFPLHALPFCFGLVWRTPRFVTGNASYQTSLTWVKDQMKCEADISGHVSRSEAPFLRKIFSLSNLPLQSVAPFPCSCSILLLLLSHLLFDLSTPRFVLCPHLRLSFAFLAAKFLGRLSHLLALSWTACAIQKHSISS